METLCPGELFIKFIYCQFLGKTERMGYTVYKEATEWIGAVLRKGGIREPDAFINCTVDIICMIEKEGDSSVVRDVVVLHH